MTPSPSEGPSGGVPGAGGDATAWLSSALAPRYQVERELGRGGMATVFLATDTQHGRKVAIKVLQTTDALGNTDRFLREIRVTARLSHPHILPLLDSGLASGTPYYVMPYVTGDSLRDRLAREGPLPLEEVVRLTAEIADALDAAHKHGVIHRDIKPGNVLLEEGHAIVADFGLVRALHAEADSAMTGTGVAVGTPAYMSPEQASGEGIVDGRSDVYSLGCVVYEMLAGEPPFTAPSAQALVAKKLSLPVVPVSTFREALPPAVDQVLKVVLARMPADRYRCAGAFASALADAVRTGEREATGRLGRRRTLVTGAVTAVALAVAGVAAWMAFGPTGPSLDDRKVVVFPLDDGRGGMQDGLLVAQLIQGVLEHAGSLKLIDGWSRLDPRQRVDIASLGPAAERELAVAQGARYYIAGRLIPRGDSLHVFLRVHDAQGDSLVAQSTGAGRADQPITVGFETLTRLLPAWIDPGRKVDLSPVRDRDPGAVVSWIRGEREYRLGHFPEARELFESAVKADTLFAFAALKGAQAASWQEDAPASRAFAERALAQVGQLPPKHRLLAQGLHYYWVGQADSSVAALRAAIAMDPDWQEAWMALGETYFHLLPSDVTDEGMAREYLEHAWSLDPDFNPPLIHLAEFALRHGDTELGGRLVAILAEARPNEAVTAHLGLMRDCVLGKVGPDEWRRVVALDSGRVALSAAKRLSEGGSQIACAEDGFRALWEGEPVLNAYRWAGALGLQAVYVAGSRFDAARVVLDSAMAWVGSAVGPWMVVADLAGAPFDSAAARYAEGLAERFGPGLPGASDRIRWVIGAWHASRLDTLNLRAVLSETRTASASGQPAARLALGALTAHEAGLSGRTDEALRALEGLSPVVPQYDLMWEPLAALPLERLLKARLLLAEGRAAEALRVASAFDHPAPIVYLEFLPESLRLRREAALALDSLSLARSLADRLESLQGNATPVSFNPGGSP